MIKILPLIARASQEQPVHAPQLTVQIRDSSILYRSRKGLDLTGITFATKIDALVEGLP